MLSIRATTRPGRKIKEVKKLVLHDPGNNQSAKQVISWFENPSNDRHGSYHEIIARRTIYHLIPFDEIAHHAGKLERSESWWEMGTSGMQNHFSLGICLIREGFDLKFVASELSLLCNRFGLHPYRDIFCHFEIDSLKTDPLIFYQNPELLMELKARATLGQEYDDIRD